MPMLPSVRAQLAERFILNFRMPPAQMQTHLPVSWLAPQVINGYAVVSYCLLDLRNITVAPLPGTFGLNSISCAPRYAVLDKTQSAASPAVFVTERQTNSSFGAWFTTLGFSAPHPHVEASIEHEDGQTRLVVMQTDGPPIFEAQVRPASALNSQLFSSTRAFADFIAEGVSSYGLSRHGNRLTKMDLHKEDATYEALETLQIGGPIVAQWEADGAVLDSAFRTSGGRYEWTYHGLTE